jgi:hypothetical protein
MDERQFFCQVKSDAHTDRMLSRGWEIDLRIQREKFRHSENISMAYILYSVFGLLS